MSPFTTFTKTSQFQILILILSGCCPNCYNWVTAQRTVFNCPFFCNLWLWSCLIIFVTILCCEATNRGVVFCPRDDVFALSKLFVNFSCRVPAVHRSLWCMSACHKLQHWRTLSYLKCNSLISIPTISWMFLVSKTSNNLQYIYILMIQVHNPITHINYFTCIILHISISYCII